MTQNVLPRVAPQSLAIDRNTQTREEKEVAEMLVKNTDLLLPGDIILIKTAGTFYQTARSLTDSNYDHAVVLVNKGMVLHMGPPVSRLLPVERVLVPSRFPKILRPKFTELQRIKFVCDCEGFVGVKYDAVRVYNFMVRLMADRYSSYFLNKLPPFISNPINSLFKKEESLLSLDFVLPPHTDKTAATDVSKSKEQPDDRPWICSDAILSLLISNAPPELKMEIWRVRFLDNQGKDITNVSTGMVPLDYVRFGSASISDFEVCTGFYYCKLIVDFEFKMPRFVSFNSFSFY